MSRLAALLLALALAACAPAGRQPAPVGSKPPDAPASTGDEPGSGAGGLLAFTAPTLTGDQVDGAALRGEALALWFWAPW